MTHPSKHRWIEPWDGSPPRTGTRLPVTDPRSPSYWLDRDFLRSFSESIIRPWADHYFRAEVHGASHLVEARPAILAMNHSGMGWPWDAIILMHKLPALFDYRREWIVRGFALPFFFQLPGLAPLILRTGMYPATFHNLDRLLAERELVLYFPEGVGGIGKGWHRRYQAQRFHTSFVKASVKYGAPILPCVCIGAEELNPFAVNVPALAELARLPIFPLSPLQLALFPTWLSSAFFALPSRLRYFIGPPVRFKLDPAKASEADYRAAAEELRQIMQAMLNEHKPHPKASYEPSAPRPSPARRALLSWARLPDKLSSFGVRQPSSNHLSSLSLSKGIVAEGSALGKGAPAKAMQSDDGPQKNAPVPSYTYPWSGFDRALATLPFGWPVLYARFWNAYQEARGIRQNGPAYEAHPLSTAEQLAFLFPWAWLFPVLRRWTTLRSARGEIEALLRPRRDGRGARGEHEEAPHAKAGSRRAYDEPGGLTTSPF